MFEMPETQKIYSTTEDGFKKSLIQWIEKYGDHSLYNINQDELTFEVSINEKN